MSQLGGACLIGLETKCEFLQHQLQLRDPLKLRSLTLAALIGESSGSSQARLRNCI